MQGAQKNSRGTQQCHSLRRLQYLSRSARTQYSRRVVQLKNHQRPRTDISDRPSAQSVGSFPLPQRYGQCIRTCDERCPSVRSLAGTADRGCINNHKVTIQGGDLTIYHNDDKLCPFSTFSCVNLSESALR